MRRTCLLSLMLVLGLAALPAAQRGGAAVPPAAQGDFVMKDFRFTDGSVLPELRIHYTTLGAPRKGPDGKVNNAVIVLHGTTGSGSGFLSAGFAGQLFGAGQLLDAATHYIILPDGIGTGRSSKPSDGLKGRFPKYGYEDMVTAQYRLVTEGLGVNHLLLVMGTSMGCMHSWMWGERYPDMMDGLVPLACVPTQIAGRNRMMRQFMAEAIRNDPAWMNGDYATQPVLGLRAALHLMFMMQSVPLQQQRTSPTRDAAEQAANQWIAQRLKTVDANDYLYQFEASRDYDPSGKLEQITAPVLAINSADDQVNPPELGLMEKLMPRVKRGRFILIPISDETRGHGTHSMPAIWGKYLAEFLREIRQEATPAARELAAVIDAIVTRPAQGAPRPDPAGLLARVRAIDVAGLSFDEQIDRRFAETILVGRAIAAPAGQPMGEAAYTRMLREQHLLPYDAAGLWTFAWREFDATVRQLEALAKRIDATKTWLQIANEVKQDHPEPLRMIEAHQEVVDRARAHLVAKDLMSLPWPETCTVVRRVPTAGNNPYYGNFSGATSRAPAADGTLRGEWHINPYDPTWDATRQRDYLVEHDWGVILVTAPHETYGGHHVQILYQMHNPRPLRRQQGTSMFSEGWGLYNEQLFQETGFLPTVRLHMRQLQLRLWRNARVIYDVGMQTGRMSRAEAIALMVDRVGFLKWAAESEVDSALARPGYFIGYFMGMTEILKMREDYRRARGSAFTLKDFHDRLLRIGSMPPALVREVLMKDVPRQPPSPAVAEALSARATGVGS